VPRPPALPAEQKTAIILAILAGQTTAAEAARKAGVSSQAISSWKRRFIQAGREGLDAGTDQQSSRELELMNEVSMLKSALGDSYLQLQAMSSARPGRPTAGAQRPVRSAPQYVLKSRLDDARTGRPQWQNSAVPGRSARPAAPVS